MRDKKEVNLIGIGSGKKLGRIEGRESKIRIYYLFLIKGKNTILKL